LRDLRLVHMDITTHNDECADATVMIF
jgi:hypothetical protein